MIITLDTTTSNYKWATHVFSILVSVLTYNYFNHWQSYNTPHNNTQLSVLRIYHIHWPVDRKKQLSGKRICYQPGNSQFGRNIYSNENECIIIIDYMPFCSDGNLKYLRLSSGPKSNSSRHQGQHSVLFAVLTLRSWRWGSCLPTNCRWASTRQHGVKTRKIVPFNGCFVSVMLRFIIFHKMVYGMQNAKG
jgi:hypothetical protein